MRLVEEFNRTFRIKYSYVTLMKFVSKEHIGVDNKCASEKNKNKIYYQNNFVKVISKQQTYYKNFRRRILFEKKRKYENMLFFKKSKKSLFKMLL
jgi:hypothetical protein